MANRDDVLSDFTIEEEMSPAVLKDYLQRYPEYTKDLLALFNELSLSDLEATEANLPLETKAMTAEALRVQHVRQSLFGNGVKELAREMGLPRAFFMGLKRHGPARRIFTRSAQARAAPRQTRMNLPFTKPGIAILRSGYFPPGIRS